MAKPKPKPKAAAIKAAPVAETSKPMRARLARRRANLQGQVKALEDVIARINQRKARINEVIAEYDGRLATPEVKDKE